MSGKQGSSDQPGYLDPGGSIQSEQLLKLPLILTSLMQTVVEKAFEKLRLAISTRRLHVMFEPSLHCDPMLDHTYPKNVLPLFEKAIATSQVEIQAQTYPAVMEALSNIEVEDDSKQIIAQLQVQAQQQKGLVRMLQDEIQEFQQEMREYQRHALEAENKLTIQMHYNLEQTKQLIGTDIYQPD